MHSGGLWYVRVNSNAEVVDSYAALLLTNFTESRCLMLIPKVHLK